jgi:hypothetical protein
MIVTSFHQPRLTDLQYICRPGPAAHLKMERSDIPMSKAISGEYPGTAGELLVLNRELR